MNKTQPRTETCNIAYYYMMNDMVKEACRKMDVS